MTTPTPTLIILMVVVAFTLSASRRRRQGRVRPPRRLPWAHLSRRRHRAEAQARQLFDDLLGGDHVDAFGHLAAGVVLQPGELTWAAARTHLSVQSSRSTWITHTRVSWWGRQAETTGRHHTTSAWARRGQVDWVLTSQRLAGRLSDGELVSIWWNTITALHIDLRPGQLGLQTTNGWRATLHGPEVASIAVTAIAGCHGPANLLAHPALTPLRSAAPGRPTHRALGPGEHRSASGCPG